jgi:hypothetical protein
MTAYGSGVLPDGERSRPRGLTAVEHAGRATRASPDECTGRIRTDLSNARRPGREVQRVNVDFPVDLLRAIDREARRIGVTRQAFIKLRLSDTLVNP